MPDKDLNSPPFYVYCHKCENLLAKCSNAELANVVASDYYKRTGHEHSVGSKCYFDNVYPDVVLEKPVTIYINDGCVSVQSKPFGVELEIRDYDVEGMWTEEDPRCKKDEDGDDYQEMIWI